MLSIVEQTIEKYTKNFKTPTTEEIKIDNKSLLENTGSIFITLYTKGEIRGSAGNIKEIKQNIAEEIIENTVSAISKDTRFKPLRIDEIKDTKIRIDKITNRKILQDKEILQIDPTKFGVLAIKKDYTTMNVILPNINPLLLTGEDLIPILEAKFNIKKFEEKDYIIYSIETEVTDNFDTK